MSSPCRHSIVTELQLINALKMCVYIKNSRTDLRFGAWWFGKVQSTMLYARHESPALMWYGDPLGFPLFGHVLTLMLCSYFVAWKEPDSLDAIILLQGEGIPIMFHRPQWRHGVQIYQTGRENPIFSSRVWIDFNLSTRGPRGSLGQRDWRCCQESIWTLATAGRQCVKGTSRCWGVPAQVAVYNSNWWG